RVDAGQRVPRPVFPACWLLAGSTAARSGTSSGYWLHSAKLLAEISNSRFPSWYYCPLQGGGPVAGRVHRARTYCIPLSFSALSAQEGAAEHGPAQRESR